MRRPVMFILFVVGLIGCTNEEHTMGKLNVGDMAPDFNLKDKDGNQIRLSDLREKKNAVVYFYPKDETPGCTAEACSFRDSYDDFKEVGAEVIGISSDGSNSHGSFAAKHGLQFILLSDLTGKVRKQYGAYDLFGMIPGRVTFVIDKHGRVIHKFDSQLSPTKHINESLEMLRKLN